MSKVFNNKRKPLTPSTGILSSKAKVAPIWVEDLVIYVPGYSNCYFKRLKYKGCPVLTPQKEFARGVELIEKNRDNLIRDLYHLLNNKPNVTTFNRFHSFIRYVKWIDEESGKKDIDDYFHFTLIDEFMVWCAKQNKLGLLSRDVYGRIKTDICWLLKQKGREEDVDKLPTVQSYHAENKGHKALDIESELKPTVRALFRAFRVLIKHYHDGTVPDKHPLYDEKLVNQETKRRGLKGVQLASHRGAFKSSVSRAHPNNPITKIAMLICYMFTGINTKPLADLRISDVSIKQVLGNKYILESIKGRANYQEQDNSMGFSKHAKEFIEEWLGIVRHMSQGDNNFPLFPYFTIKNETKFYSQIAEKPQKSVNRLLKKLGLTPINPSRFRKTKMDTLYRVTESVYLVSVSANNSLKVVASAYANGTEQEHENNLGASMDAKFSLAKGEDINSAIHNAKFKFGDILDDYEYQSLREGNNRDHESRTPVGIRCNNNKKGAAKTIEKALKRAGIQSVDKEIVCTDFLSC